MFRTIPTHPIIRLTSRILFSRIGEWRTDLLWRFFGLVICQLGVLLLYETDTVEELLRFPVGLHLAIGCGLLLILFGARLLLLILTSIAMSVFLIPWTREVVERQVADEYILLMVLPAMGVCLTFISLLRKRFQNQRGFDLDSELNGRNSPHAPVGLPNLRAVRPPTRRATESIGIWRSQSSEARTADDEIDSTHVALFRISILGAMFFAALHKLNYDFFDPTVSCAPELSKELAFWWRLPFPDAVLNAKPYQILLGEGLIPVLLLLYPRIGILFTTLFLGLIGHIGPTVFTMTMFMMACAFFRAEDGAVMLRGLKRCWSGLLTFTLVMSAISFKLFTGKRTWFEFHVYQVVIIILTFCVLYLLAADWNRLRRGLIDQPSEGSPLDFERFGHKPAAFDPNRTPKETFRRFFIHMGGLLPSQKAVKIALICYALLLFLNGMSPYFGLKYRYSFAMLSNLRADDARWNSMVIPKWFYLRQHDPFIHVTRVETDRYTRRRLAKLEQKRKREMLPGLISPMSFKHRLDILKRIHAKVDIEFTYRGDSYFYEDAANNEGLERWLGGIPDSKMFQEWLAGEGPQPCVH
jgi:hypothetical protein